MSERGKHGQQPNKTNYEDIIDDLLFGTLTIRSLELAYREYIRRRTDIPEGARNLLVGKQGLGLIQFASQMGELVGNVELAYMRGRQEGYEEPDMNKWDGGFENKPKPKKKNRKSVEEYCSDKNLKG